MGAFFEMLVARKFPTTTRLRGRADLEYTPKPDIFHDVFGYVPMHAHAIFLQRVPSVMAACVRRSTIARCANVLGGFFGIPSSLVLAEFTLADSVPPRATNHALIAAQKVRKIHMDMDTN